MQQRLKYTLVLLLALGGMSLQPVWAAGPPAPSIFSNSLALMMLIFMLLLMIVIGILATILMGAAEIRLRKRKSPSGTPVLSVLLLVAGLLAAPGLMAQDAAAAPVAAKTIGGMAASTFYLMATVIFIELGVILVMLINIKFLLNKEKEKEAVISAEETAEMEKNRLSWWDRFNKLKPVSQEAELDLGHEYDGIRELNNRLPPWWLYGFYITIIFAVIYLWRFHVSHNGPSSAEEYDRSVAAAELKIQAYLKAKGDAVDENTVTLLTGADDIASGKMNFEKSCASCHKPTGGGDVGPNLTDNFWLHGNDVKSIFKTIKYGINAMPQWQNAYSNKQIAQLTSYVKSLHGSNPPNPKAPQGVEMKEEPAPAAAKDSTGAKPAADSAKISTATPAVK